MNKLNTYVVDAARAHAALGFMDTAANILEQVQSENEFTNAEIKKILTKLEKLKQVALHDYDAATEMILTHNVQIN